MRKSITITNIIASAVMLCALIGIKVNRTLTPKPIEHIDTEHEEELPLNEQEEAKEMDGSTKVSLHAINFGDLTVPCPLCNIEVDTIMVGLGTVEDVEESNGPVNELYQIGIIYYPCGHIVNSPCLVDKVANILNAEEIGKLEPGLFHNLMSCSTHGGNDGGT